MRTSEIVSLPITLPEYETVNEQLMRRTVEQALASLRQDIVDAKNTTDRASSLALRRHQFLLMGAT